MTVASYDILPDWLMDLIDESRVLIGDIGQRGKDWFTDDMWAIILKATVNDFNRTRPPTNFGYTEFPAGMGDVLQLGVLYYAASTRANHLRENLTPSGFTGPYVDIEKLIDRWDRKTSEIKPLWIDTRNRAKLEFLPSGVGTVGMYNYSWGSSGAIINTQLRSLPTWGWAR